MWLGLIVCLSPLNVTQASPSVIQYKRDTALQIGPKFQSAFKSARPTFSNDSSTVSNTSFTLKLKLKCKYNIFFMFNYTKRKKCESTIVYYTIKYARLWIFNAKRWNNFINIRVYILIFAILFIILRPI